MSTIFQVSDLAAKRVEVVEAARSGVARLRHKDGTSLVMMRESNLEWLQDFANWSTAHLRLEQLLRRDVVPSVADLGDLAWLRAFDLDDLKEFVAELEDALVATHADQASDALQTCIAAWRTTAAQLDDPLRRQVLLNPLNEDEYVSVDAPVSADSGIEAVESSDG
jgi:hypothetical protein